LLLSRLTFTKKLNTRGAITFWTRALAATLGGGELAELTALLTELLDVADEVPKE